MWRYLIVFLVYIVFFLIVPSLGAFQVRKRWRAFRKNMTDSTMLPQVSYNQLVHRMDGFLGFFRFLGHIEAIQGDDTVWIRSGNISLSAELADVIVYLLPSFSHAENEGVVERNEETLPDEMPQQLPWSRIFNLPEGTQVYLSGPLYSAHGHGVFRTTRQHPLTVVIYDGETDTILRRSIWGGRQRTEYWNKFTPSSLIAGSLALLEPPMP